MNGTKRAALYCRVSTADQTAENQRGPLEAVARARGLSIEHVYVEAESTRKRRPTFERMMNDARSGAFDVLLIWAIDRFGRDTIGNMTALAELDRVGVRVVSARETWLDTTGPTRTLLVAVFSWVAEQEREQRSERTKAGLARVRAHGSKSGKAIGRPKRLNADDVARARELHAAGRSVRSIAMALKIPRATVARTLASQNGVRQNDAASASKRAASDA